VSGTDATADSAAEDSDRDGDQEQRQQPVSATAPEIQNSEFKIQNSKTRLIPAAPTVRRFAREVGIDIATVPGTGSGGRISIDDVKAEANRRLSRSGGGGIAAPAVDLPDFSRWGTIRREPMSKVRSLTSEAMTRAWLTAPQVTNHELADITELEDLRRTYKQRVEAAGGKLSLTAILIKVVATALKRFPNLNASIDPAGGEIIFKEFIHIGVAVDTERGLLVPVIRDADRKNITEIAIELEDLAARARNRKLKPDEMQGGTFSISNLGGIGGTGFSPIVNWPEVAILGVSRNRIQPEWIDDDFEPRRMLPLSLSYDHRLIDGAEAARFLSWLTEALEQPLLLALEG
jgi:pyruvate dehydrogenase E2 component (dihydrolipoamide acetyltransferase)